MRFVFFVVIGRDLGKYGQDSNLLTSLKRGFENSNWSKKIDFLELFMTKFVSFLGGTLAHEAYKALSINGLQGYPPFRPDRTAVLTRIF
jgi:hypothetical protein